jgi:hypothetical protein
VAWRCPKGGKSPLDIVQGLFNDEKAAIVKLLAADSPQEALAVGRDIFVQSLGDLWGTVGPLLASQLDVLISFSTAALTLPTAGPATTH